jgi:hypothetical protein
MTLPGVEVEISEDWEDFDEKVESFLNDPEQREFKCNSYPEHDRFRDNVGEWRFSEREAVLDDSIFRGFLLTFNNGIFELRHIDKEDSNIFIFSKTRTEYDN